MTTVKTEGDTIIRKITEHIVEIPKDKSPEELIQWLYGYMAAQNDIISIIAEHKKRRCNDETVQ